MTALRHTRGSGDFAAELNWQSIQFRQIIPSYSRILDELRLSTKCARRRLAEQSLVVDREPPKVREAKLRRDGRYSCRIGRRLTQRPSRLMHAAQQEVALWARSQILLAAHAQRSLRDPDRLADLQDIEWFSRVLLNRLPEAMHDNCMLRLRQALS